MGKCLKTYYHLVRLYLTLTDKRTGVVENNLIYYIYHFIYYFQTCRRLNWLPQDRYWVLIMKQVSLIHFPFVYIIELRKKRRNYLGLVGLIKIIVFWKI